MEESEQTFSQRLTEEIEYNGMKKSEFARKVGLSLGTLNMYLYRNTIPAADVAVKMAAALNTTTEYLVTGKMPKKRSDWQKAEILSIVDNLGQNQLKCFLEIARSYQCAIGN